MVDGDDSSQRYRTDNLPALGGRTVGEVIPRLLRRPVVAAGIVFGTTGCDLARVENWWTVALEPGNYLVICFVPDLTTRAAHFSMAMVQPFTVSAAG